MFIFRTLYYVRIKQNDLLCESRWRQICKGYIKQYAAVRNDFKSLARLDFLRIGENTIMYCACILYNPSQQNTSMYQVEKIHLLKNVAKKVCTD